MDCGGSNERAATLLATMLCAWRLLDQNSVGRVASTFATLNRYILWSLDPSTSENPGDMNAENDQCIIYVYVMYYFFAIPPLLIDQGS